MEQRDVTRRSFVFAGAGLAAGALAQPPGGALAAGEVVERIKANVGIPWRDKTVDNIIAGAAETPVRGIAVMMMATLEMVRRAAASGRNMVITHEPAFFSHQDTVADYEKDATYQQKRDFLNKNGMAVFHFHDHWHGMRPDGIGVGMARELGWEKYANPGDPRRFVLPQASLLLLAQDIQTKLGARTMRVVGNPKAQVSRVATSWGYATGVGPARTLALPDVDVLILGETREWELVEFAQDIIASGQNKALIIVGHVMSEQAGMKHCAEWLKSFVKEVPIEYLPMEEPFWNPNDKTA